MPKASNPKLLEFIRKTTEFPDQKWVRTGLHALDLILGDGIPRGKVIELYGPEGGGKSALAWMIGRAFQNEGGVVLLYDVEATAPKKWMTTIGIREDHLIYRAKSQKVQKGEVVERAYDSIEVIINDMLGLLPEIQKLSDHMPILVVWDSIAATSSESEWEKKDGVWRSSDREYFANRARSLSIMLPRIVPRLPEFNATLLAVNQLREKPGVLYGKKTDSTGGRSLKHYASIRLHIRRDGDHEVNGQKIGANLEIRVDKTKLTEPFRKATVRLLWKNGFEPHSGILPVLEAAGRVQPGKGSGQWTWNGAPVNTKNVQGLLEKNPGLTTAWV